MKQQQQHQQQHHQQQQQQIYTSERGKFLVFILPKKVFESAHIYTHVSFKPRVWISIYKRYINWVWASEASEENFL